jgi:hypothetical protein
VLSVGDQPGCDASTEVGLDSLGYLPMSRSNGSRTRQSPRALKITLRAKLAPGENVLILGATGVTGKLAVRIAKLLGAARVVSNHWSRA